MTLGPRAAIWLAFALVVSLAANLFVVGVFAGRYFGAPAATEVVDNGGGDPARFGNRRGVPRVIRRMAERLPPEHRRVFLETIRARRAAMREAGFALQRARLALRDEIARETLDKERLARAFGELRRRNIAMQKILQDAVAEAVGKLPADARQRMVEFHRPGANR